MVKKIWLAYQCEVCGIAYKTKIEAERCEDHDREIEYIEDNDF